MVTRIVVGLLLGPAFLAALFFLCPAALAVIVAFIAGMASFELLRAAKIAHHNGMYACTALAAALIPLGHGAGRRQPEPPGPALRSLGAVGDQGALGNGQSGSPL